MNAHGLQPTGDVPCNGNGWFVRLPSHPLRSNARVWRARGSRPERCLCHRLFVKAPDSVYIYLGSSTFIRLHQENGERPLACFGLLFFLNLGQLTKKEEKSLDRSSMYSWRFSLPNISFGTLKALIRTCILHIVARKKSIVLCLKIVRLSSWGWLYCSSIVGKVKRLHNSMHWEQTVLGNQAPKTLRHSTTGSVDCLKRVCTSYPVIWNT